MFNCRALALYYSVSMDPTDVMDLSDMEEDEDTTGVEFDTYPRTEELECM